MYIVKIQSFLIRLYRIYIVHYFKKEQLKNIQDILDFCTIFNTVRAITNTKQMNAIRSRWTR